MISRLNREKTAHMPGLSFVKSIKYLSMITYSNNELPFSMGDVIYFCYGGMPMQTVF